MMIVDSQVHIWAADTPERPWPKGRPVKAQRDVPLEKDELLREMDAAGVARVVIVPPSWEGDRNDLGLAAAKAHPDRFAVMGRIDPEAPESRGKIAGWRKQPGMLGLRFVFHRSPLLELLTEGRADWLWPEAEKHGVPVYMLVPHRHMHLVDRIAARHPRLKLVMDHSGLVDGRDDEAFKEFDKLLALARHPNVATKVSCFRSSRPRSTPSAISIPISARHSTRSARSARSGAPISRACRARTGRASRSSPRSCRG